VYDILRGTEDKDTSKEDYPRKIEIDWRNEESNGTTTPATPVMHSARGNDGHKSLHTRDGQERKHVL
jgi:hypothetical protein